jgi:hypothetical protein
MKFSQWTVWLANLDPIVGSEQGKAFDCEVYFSPEILTNTVRAAFAAKPRVQVDSLHSAAYSLLREDDL